MDQVKWRDADNPEQVNTMPGGKFDATMTTDLFFLRDNPAVSITVVFRDGPSRMYWMETN